MELLLFDWDEKKNISNTKKHGITFQEAQTVFYDENAIVFDDDEHSIGEERFLIIGLSFQYRILIVSHCYRENENLIRIISARKATKHESNTYYELRGDKK